MMEELKFASVNDLYKRVLPALKSKRKELTKDAMAYIKEEDIWNYLKSNKWNQTSSLNLHDMVNDILMVDNTFLDVYVKNKFGSFSRFLDETENLL